MYFLLKSLEQTVDWLKKILYDWPSIGFKISEKKSLSIYTYCFHLNKQIPSTNKYVLFYRETLRVWKHLWWYYKNVRSLQSSCCVIRSSRPAKRRILDNISFLANKFFNVNVISNLTRTLKHFPASENSLLHISIY